MTKQEELDQVITDLRDNVADITGVMVATSDGLSIASDFPEDEAIRIAAVGAAASGLGDRIAKNASLGEIHETMVKGSDGLLLIYLTDHDGLLAIRATATGNLGFVRLEASNACEAVRQILGQS